MKIVILQLLSLLISFHATGQTSISTKEIKIPYTNGFELFNICVKGCQISFQDSQDYYWYTEFSNVKSTKGGSGGSLLHGNYKFFDENGNLRIERNFYLGLLNGNEKEWDSIGNITMTSKFKNGDRIYWKFKNEDYWIEHIGEIFTKGWIKKTYTSYNKMISEVVMVEDYNMYTKIYNLSGKDILIQEYTASGLNDEFKYGDYKEFYENGKIKVMGQFHKGKYANIRIGTWSWYNLDGTISGTFQYKDFFDKWSNGEVQVVGGYVLDTETNTWAKDGNWEWYDEEGNYVTSKKYDWGEEVKE